MAEFARSGNELKVSGLLSAQENDHLTGHGNDLIVNAEAPELILDVSAASFGDSSFVGVIAQLGGEARSRSKTLIVRAAGRPADLLVWAGLHRLVTLHVSAEPAAASA